jgi:polar amino acid transport system permease protein
MKTTEESVDASTDPQPPPRTSVRPTVVPVRQYGRWVLGTVVLVALGLVVRAFAAADIQYDKVIAYFVDPGILLGVVHTLELTLMSMALALVLGVTVAVMRQSDSPVLQWTGAGYTWLFRGTPLLVQLLLWFNLSLIFKTFTIPGIYSVPMNQFMTPFIAALLGLGVNEGAYIAEIVRGGILSVDRGQREAAAAIGMTRAKTMRRIVLPQAMRVIVPPLGNEFIALLKYSSLAFAISYSELLNSANKIYTANFLVIELLFAASLWYILLTTVFSVLQQLMERRLNRGVDGQRITMGARLRRNMSLRRPS